MGAHTAAALEGHQFRPTSYELSDFLRPLGPRDASTPAPDVPPAGEWAFPPRTLTNDQNTRIGLIADVVWKFKRIFGYVAPIDEADALNTYKYEYGFLYEIDTPIPYQATECSTDVARMSYLYCKAMEYSSNSRAFDFVVKMGI